MADIASPVGPDQFVKIGGTVRHFETEGYPMALSLPKQKIRVLLLEGVNNSAVRLFEANGYTEVERLPKALDADGAEAGARRACTCSASARARS